MTGGKFSQHFREAKGDSPPQSAPLGGTRAEAAQRLQVGLFGLGAMILLVGLANVLGNQAELTEENSVPEAAPTTEPSDSTTQRDPLVDAGIVPEIPAEPIPEPEEGQVEDLPDSVVADSEPTDDGEARQ